MHPLRREMLPTGGYFSLPKLYADGTMLIGDTAGMCNGEVKGVHLAIKSGMLAAETLVEAIRKDDFSAQTLSTTERLNASWIYEEHYKARNFHGSFESTMPRWLLAAPAAVDHQRPCAREGPAAGRPAEAGAHAPRQRAHDEALGALSEGAAEEGEGRVRQQADLRQGHRRRARRLTPRGRPAAPPARADTNVCATTCATDYGNPCENFCPAAVYEMIRRRREPGPQAPRDPPRELRPLQDLRRRRSVRDHHLDDARGRRRARLHADVSKGNSRSFVIRAGARAAARLRDEGFHAELFDTLVGASGGPKWLVLRHLDDVLIDRVVLPRTTPLDTLGSSIGSFRHACFAQRDPHAALARFADGYIGQAYHGAPTPEVISDESGADPGAFPRRTRRRGNRLEPARSLAYRGRAPAKRSWPRPRSRLPAAASPLPPAGTPCPGACSAGPSSASSLRRASRRSRSTTFRHGTHASSR